MDNKYVVAKYLRISSDDGFHGDSQSISNQRDLVSGFISAHPELKNAQCLEFCDDGYSGTNFDRPGVQQLLDGIKTGKIHCIVVKDFSRFGRNYIDVGDYIEQVFPFLRVRFISINDHYDSAVNGYAAGDVSVAFKHLCNDYYCKDLSRKVKSGLKTHWEEGKYLSSYQVYGYTKSPDNIHKLVIEEETAAVVRRIFDMAVSGNTPTQIAAALNADKVTTPMTYLAETKKIRTWSNLARIWTNIKVMHIIRDLRYTGTMVNGTYEVVEFGTHRTRRTDESSWFVKENTHEPIVSKEKYDKAQLVIRKINKGASRAKTRVPSPYSFPVKIRCGGCGHALVKNSAKIMAYYCRYKDTNASDFCFTGRIEVDTLREVFLVSIQRLYGAVMEIKKAAPAETAEPAVDLLKELRSVQREIDHVTTSKLNLYNRYRDGDITREDYISQRGFADERLQGLSAQKTTLEENYNRQEAEITVNPVCEILQDKTYPSEYSNELVAALVDYVVVHDEQRLEIKWKFADAIKDSLSVMGGVFDVVNHSGYVLQT